MRLKASTLSIFYLFIILLTAGCVGTVEEVAPPGSLKLTYPPTTFDFPGIVTSRAISHNKVELEFFPSGGSDVVYKLYINNSSTPITIDAQSLLTVNGGKLLYTVNNLTPDREYKFKIVALKPKTNAISKNEQEAYSRTFDNVVANFDGITKVSLVPGNTSGSIMVDWISPAMSGVFSAGAFDPVRYEVTVISEIGGAGNLNNPAYSGTDKRVVLVPSPPARATPLSNPQNVEIANLSPNTRYFIQVRAINTLYQNYAEDPAVTTIPVSREVNTRYLSLKTDPAGSLFDFRQDNVVLTNAPGVDAFDKLDVFWQPGSGSFSGYRIFVRKYDGVGDPKVDDKLIEATLQSQTLSGNYINVLPTATSKRITSLENYSWYQVKVALCKTINCPVLSTDPNAAIVSDLTAIQVKPILAAFSGINTIEPPGQFSEKDVVQLKFDAPLINSGFANIMEFYCVNPADHSQQVLLDSSALVGSAVPLCDGLYLEGAIPPLASFTKQKVRGMISDGSTEYCFAATPAISGFGPDIRLATGNRIVRCAYPEVLPPTIAQFSGLNNSCAVSGTNAYLTWKLPTGGIYSGFKVFWREKSSVDKFSFPYAITPDPQYTNSGELTAATLSYTAPNLMPGKTYQMGVLATVDMNLPIPDLYSEYNLSVVECVVPLPIASFKGFTRIFAVGPKLDGRIPNSSVTGAPQVSGANNSLIYEALDDKGIPYEIAMDAASSPNISSNFTAPPGRDFGASFGGAFDGVSESNLGYAMAREGIVSLAWEDVEMDFPEALTLFTGAQPAAPASRAGRLWGYKVFRSHDNKLTWKELTTINGPVYSSDYTYYKRPNASSVTSRMAFFTDYSVKALYETHDAANAMDIDRARTYFYKIVPVFDGKNLSYVAGNHHIVRVTLPPPNMALVHRWMTNRARCLELDKEPIIGADYSCSYNGIGSYPNNIPHRVGDTVLDQGGDLLVDRQELGCHYTRGEKTSTPEVGASSFELIPGSRRHPSDINFYPLFKGYRTVGNVEDPSTTFRGCAGNNLPNIGDGTGVTYPVGFIPEYQRYLQGDCLGPHLDKIARSTCTTTAFTEGNFDTYNINVPGADINTTAAEDCSVNPSFDPSNITNKYMGYWAPNLVMQSEFLAVYYNSFPLSLVSHDRVPPIEGPSPANLTSSQILNASYINDPGSSSCSINLASIDGQGYMKPRWISVNELGFKRINFKGTNQDLLGKTVDELTEVQPSLTAPLTFYNGNDGDLTAAAFKLPSANLRTSSRYRGTTRIGRILASPSAKLPPLGRLSSEIAESLCANFYVQTGIASENGNFLPDSKPQGKRTLRRIESISASAWSETYNTAAVANLEASNSDGSCVNAYKNVGNSNPNKGSLLNNRMTVTNNLLNIPLVTGSSRYNGLLAYNEPFHSARCTSRYGIQDMVGNVSEANSERIFCDYSQDKINLGPVTGTWGGGDNAQNAGTGGPDYPFFNDNNNDWWVLKSGTPTANDGSAFEMRFRDGSPARTDIKPWVKISVDSGYCSIVDSNPAKRTGTDMFKDLMTGYWNPIFLPGGALNTSIVEKPQTDQEAVATWRNGDGRFLDFGPQGIGASMNKANNLALSGATAISKYFNPVIGLPLKCENYSCNDSALSSPNDNTSVTIPTLATNIVSGVDDAPSISNFPVGNSQITHLGVSDYQYSASAFSSRIVPLSGVSTTGAVNVLQAVLFDDPVTLGNPVRIAKTFPSDFTGGDTIEYYELNWDVERGAEFGIISGGGSNASATGRYTASMSKAAVGPVILTGGSSSFSSGARCAVMINQD